MEKSNRKIRKFFSRLFKRKKRSNNYQKFEESDKARIITSSGQNLNRKASSESRQLREISNAPDFDKYDKRQHHRNKLEAQTTFIESDATVPRIEAVDEEREAELRRLFPLSYDASKRVSTHSDTSEPPKKKKKRRKKKKKGKEEQERIDALQALPLPEEDIPIQQTDNQTTIVLENNNLPNPLESIEVNPGDVEVSKRPPVVDDLIVLQEQPVALETTFPADPNDIIADHTELPTPEAFLAQCSKTITSDVTVHFGAQPSNKESEGTQIYHNGVSQNDMVDLRINESINGIETKDELQRQIAINTNLSENVQVPGASTALTNQLDINKIINSIEEVALPEQIQPFETQTKKKKKKKKRKSKEKVKYVIDKENVRVEKQTYEEISDTTTEDNTKKSKKWKKNARKAGKQTWKAMKTSWKYVKAGLTQYANGPGQAMNLSNYGKYQSGQPSDHKSRHQSYYR